MEIKNTYIGYAIGLNFDEKLTKNTDSRYQVCKWVKVYFTPHSWFVERSDGIVQPVTADVAKIVMDNGHTKIYG